MPRRHGNDTKASRRAAQMPALYHRLPGEEFDSSKSEVINWLCSQREIRDAIFQHCNQLGAIIYDKSTGKWRGKDASA